MCVDAFVSDEVPEDDGW